MARRINHQSVRVKPTQLLITGSGYSLINKNNRSTHDNETSSSARPPIPILPPASFLPQLPFFCATCVQRIDRSNVNENYLHRRIRDTVADFPKRLFARGYSTARWRCGCQPSLSSTLAANRQTIDVCRRKTVNESDNQTSSTTIPGTTTSGDQVHRFPSANKE